MCFACVEILNGRAFCQIEELAAKMNLSEKEMLRELKKMIRRGAFPQGHIDEQGTCLMLDDKSYQQYLQAQQSWKQREEEQKAAKQRQAEQKKEQRREEKKGSPGDFSGNSGDGSGRWTIYYVTSRGK